MKHRRHGALVLAAALVCLVPAAAAGADSPDKVLAKIISAAHGEQSVHYKSTGNYGPEQVQFDAWAGADEGIQEIDYRKNGKSGHLTVIVTGNTAYIRGDAFTLVNYVGFKSTAALTYAGQWARF